MKRRIKSRRRELTSEEITHNVPDPLRDFQGNRAERFVAELAYSIRSNLKTTLIVTGTLVVLSSAYIFYHYYQLNSEQKALEAFEELLKNPVMTPGSGAEKVALDKLTQYLNEHNTNKSFIRVALKKIQLYRVIGDDVSAADEALAASSKLSHPDQKLYLLVEAATLYENGKSMQKALDAYAQAAKLTGAEDHYQKAFILFGEARTLIALGKKDEGADKIKTLMEMKGNDVESIHIAATAYLYRSHNP